MKTSPDQLSLEELQNIAQIARESAVRIEALLAKWDRENSYTERRRIISDTQLLTT